MKARRIQYGSLCAGGLMLGVLFILSLHPEFVTSQSPTHIEYANYKTGQSAPFPPSLVHPFGTDDVGRDFLARTLAGTWNTLYPAVAITMIVLALSMFLGTIGSTSGNKIIPKFIRSISGVMSSLPVLMLLVLVMGKRNLTSPHQEITYMIWIALFEIGRGAYAFYESMETWLGMDFVEAAITLGRTKIGILFTHLRSWLVLFFIEFAFSELARVLSIMTMLAAFHIYAIEKISSIPFFISYPPVLGIQSAQNTWIAMIGDSTNNAAFVGYPYFLYAPALALLVTVMGANLIARGIRGKIEVEMHRKRTIPLWIRKGPHQLERVGEADLQR